MSIVEQGSLSEQWSKLWDEKSYGNWMQVEHVFAMDDSAGIIANMEICKEFLVESIHFENYKKLARILSKDAGLTADVIKLINSAYYGYAFEYNELERAVGLLGPKTIASAIVTREVNHLFRMTQRLVARLKGPKKGEFKKAYDEIYQLSQTISRLAFALYRHLHKVRNPRNVDFDVVTLGLFSTLADLTALTYFLLSDQIEFYHGYHQTGLSSKLSLTKEQLCFGVLCLWRFPSIYKLCISTGFSISNFETMSKSLITIYDSTVFNSSIEYIAIIESCKILLSDTLHSHDTESIAQKLPESIREFTYQPVTLKSLSVVNLSQSAFRDMLNHGTIRLNLG
jgi:hypothetical protein